MAKPKKSKPKPVGIELHDIHAAREAEYVKHDRERFERDKAMVLDPGRWPRWPLLPVKHRPTPSRPLDWNRKDAFGFVFAGDVRQHHKDGELVPAVWRVYFGVVFAINEKVAEARREGTTGEATWSAVLNKYEHHDYEDVDAMMEVYTVD